MYDHSLCACPLWNLESEVRSEAVQSSVRKIQARTRHSYQTTSISSAPLMDRQQQARACLRSTSRAVTWWQQRKSRSVQNLTLIKIKFPMKKSLKRRKIRTNATSYLNLCSTWCTRSTQSSRKWPSNLSIVLGLMISSSCLRLLGQMNTIWGSLVSLQRRLHQTLMSVGSIIQSNTRCLERLSHINEFHSFQE